MSIKRRLEAIEKAAAMSDRDELMIFATFYEREDGGEDFVSARAFLPGSPHFQDDRDVLCSNEGETYGDYKQRIMDLVRARTGVSPASGARTVKRSIVSRKPSGVLK